MLREVEEARGGPQPPGITFPSLEEGNVRFANATLFTAPNFKAPWGYPRNDLEMAHKLGTKQLKIYQGWESIQLVKIVRFAEDLDGSAPSQLNVVLLMEGADPITTPAQLDAWFDAGLRMIGMAWSTGTRYAGGNYSKGPLTPLGQELVRRMEEKRMIHDFSHLSDEAAYEVLDRTSGPIAASHSNSRKLVGGESQRNLSDPLIRAISQRGGIIGLNLFSRFLIPEDQKRRATLDETIAHIEYICEVMERRDGIALGSDMDGGFGADKLPSTIHQPRDYTQLLERLAQRGWSDMELEGFAKENWLRFMRENLPQTEG